MSIFDINYANKTIEWMPPDKRLPKQVGFWTGLLAPVQWLRDKFLGNYRTGVYNLTALGQPGIISPTPGIANWKPAVYGLNTGYVYQYKGVVYQSIVDATLFPQYDISGNTTYQPGHFVNFGGITYVCLVATSGLNAQPFIGGAAYIVGQQVLHNGYVYVCKAANSNATFSTLYWNVLGIQYYFDRSKWAFDTPPSLNWQVYLPSFLGVDERILFNGQKLVLEYALNQYYGPENAHFRQPGLLGYYYPVDTPGTPIASDADHALHSDIFILNNPVQLQGFNIGTLDFAPKNWLSGASYTAGLSKVMYNGIEYICKANTSGSTTPPADTAHWTSLGARPANGILTTGVVTNDISDFTHYPLWGNTNYSFGAFVQYQGFIYCCIQTTGNKEAPGETAYWYKIDGIGCDDIFLPGDNFTIYFPSWLYTQTNDSEINNFVQKIVYAGIVWNIATY